MLSSFAFLTFSKIVSASALTVNDTGDLTASQVNVPSSDDSVLTSPRSRTRTPLGDLDQNRSILPQRSTTESVNNLAEVGARYESESSSDEPLVDARLSRAGQNPSSENQNPSQGSSVVSDESDQNSISQPNEPHTGSSELPRSAAVQLFAEARDEEMRYVHSAITRRNRALHHERMSNRRLRMTEADRRSSWRTFLRARLADAPQRRRRLSISSPEQRAMILRRALNAFVPDDETDARAFEIVVGDFENGGDGTDDEDVGGDRDDRTHAANEEDIDPESSGDDPGEDTSDSLPERRQTATSSAENRNLLRAQMIQRITNEMQVAQDAFNHRQEQDDAAAQESIANEMQGLQEVFDNWQQQDADDSPASQQIANEMRAVQDAFTDWQSQNGERPTDGFARGDSATESSSFGASMGGRVALNRSRRTSPSSSRRGRPTRERLRRHMQMELASARQRMFRRNRARYASELRQEVVDELHDFEEEVRERIGEPASLVGEQTAEEEQEEQVPDQSAAAEGAEEDVLSMSVNPRTRARSNAISELPAGGIDTSPLEASPLEASPLQSTSPLQDLEFDSIPWITAPRIDERTLSRAHERIAHQRALDRMPFRRLIGESIRQRNHRANRPQDQQDDVHSSMENHSDADSDDHFALMRGIPVPRNLAAQLEPEPQQQFIDFNPDNGFNPAGDISRTISSTSHLLYPQVDSDEVPEDFQAPVSPPPFSPPTPRPSPVESSQGAAAESPAHTNEEGAVAELVSPSSAQLSPSSAQISPTLSEAPCEPLGDEYNCCICMCDVDPRAVETDESGQALLLMDSRGGVGLACPHWCFHPACMERWMFSRRINTRIGPIPLNTNCPLCRAPFHVAVDITSGIDPANWGLAVSPPLPSSAPGHEARIEALDPLQRSFRQLLGDSKYIGNAESLPDCFLRAVAEGRADIVSLFLTQSYFPEHVLIDYLYAMRVEGQTPIEIAQVLPVPDVLNVLNEFQESIRGHSIRLYLPDSSDDNDFKVIIVPQEERETWTFADFRAQLASRFPSYQNCRLFFHDRKTDDRVLLLDDEPIRHYLFEDHDQFSVIAREQWSDEDRGVNIHTLAADSPTNVFRSKHPYCCLNSRSQEESDICDFLIAARVGDHYLVSAFLDEKRASADLVLQEKLMYREWQKPLYVGTTPLAEGLAHPNVVRVLLEYGADPNRPLARHNILRQDERGEEVLMVDQKFYQKIKKNISDDKNQIIFCSIAQCLLHKVPPLLLAIRWACIESAHLLLSAGATANIPGILHHALRHGIPLVNELLARGADVNSMPERLSEAARKLADTLLHKAVSHDKPGLIEILLDAGACLNAVNGVQETALDVAVRRHHLLRHGVVQVQDETRIEGCRRVIVLLQQRGATRGPGYRDE
jgi:hypothetical protein